MLKLWKKKEIKRVEGVEAQDYKNRELKCMFLKFDKKSEKLIVALIGELDHHSAEEVRVKIDDRIERDNIQKVILDFRGVSFMDSSGIGVVIGRYKKILGRRGKVCVADVNSSVDKVFKLAGLYKLIESYPNVELALESI